MSKKTVVTSTAAKSEPISKAHPAFAAMDAIVEENGGPGVMPPSRKELATRLRKALAAASRMLPLGTDPTDARSGSPLSGLIFEVRKTYLPTEPGEPNIHAVAVTVSSRDVDPKTTLTPPALASSLLPWPPSSPRAKEIEATVRSLAAATGIAVSAVTFGEAIPVDMKEGE